MTTTQQEFSQFAGKQIKIEKGNEWYEGYCMGKPDRFTDGELNRSGLFVLFDVDDFALEKTSFRFAENDGWTATPAPRGEKRP